LSTSNPKKDSWRTATMSGGNNCVQVKSNDGMIIVGNSRLADGPFLSYTRDEWVAFLDGAKKGEFDDLL
jgi:Domain of unknown function (DUF397)